MWYLRVLINSKLLCESCMSFYVATEMNSNVPEFNENSRPRPNQNFATQSNVDHNSKQEVPVSTKRKVRIDVDDFVSSKRTKTDEVEKKAVNENLPNKNEASSDHNLKQEVPVSTKRKLWSDFDDFLISKRTRNVDAEKKVAKENIPNEKASNGQNLKQEVPVSTKRKGWKDVDDFVSYKRARKVEVEKQAVKENLLNEKVSNEKEEVQNVRSFSCPDSEFYDFEKERDPKNIKPEQIWAVYDDQDAMPRFYVRIRKVNNPFSLRFTWLEHNPQSELEQLWANEGLPVACGNYRHGTSEVTKNLQMFSHEISWNKVTKRNTFNVYPRKGEVWALFKGRDDNWHSNARNHSKCEYEMVELISDCSNGPEFSVIQLVKVEGFVSLFVRSTDKPFQVPMSNILMFSHRVPAYRCSENEKEGVREGSFELDTASLPEIFGCKSVENDSSNQSTQGEKISASSNTKTDNICEFCNFSIGRSIEKVKKGQIWALYSDIDNRPNLYAKIKKVDRVHNVITASWLKLESSTVEEANWTEKGFPSARGKFKVSQKSVTFDSLEPFSHIVNVTSVDKDQYIISPKSGEVWAVYKDWNVNWTMGEFSKCQYMIVEIVECSFSVTVRVLRKAEDYKFVFKPEQEGGVMEEMVIPYQESLRFSHQIPAFKLTDEIGGAIHGYWELDSASVPANL